MALICGTLDPYVSHPLLDVIRRFDFLDIEAGPWIAGGAARRILMREPHHCGSDVDVFFPSQGWSHKKLQTALGRLITRPDDRDAYSLVENLCRKPEMLYVGPVPADIEVQEYVLNYIKVQFVFGRTYADAAAMLDDFDFTVCMAATDGRRWVADERFFRDTVSRELVMHNTDTRRYSLTRLARYCANGFTPTPGVLTNTLELDTDRLEHMLHAEACVLPGGLRGS